MFVEKSQSIQPFQLVLVVWCHRVLVSLVNFEIKKQIFFAFGMNKVYVQWLNWVTNAELRDFSPTAVYLGRASWAEESGWFSVTLHRRRGTMVLILYAGCLK